MRAAVALFVPPMRRDAVFGYLVHLKRADLHLHGQPANASDGRVEGLIHILFGIGNVHPCGDFARKMEIISKMEWLIKTDTPSEASRKINSLEGLSQDHKKSSPFSWRGTTSHPELAVEIIFNDGTTLINELLIRTSAPEHLHAIGKDNLSMAQIYRTRPFSKEEEAYLEAGLQYIPAELREGSFEVEWAKENKIPKLLEEGELKGILHNHSTYTDGKHSLLEMAEKCKEMGYEYLGISDHSQTAIYAGGLDVAKIRKQHQEIDQLNQELAPFRIFKGIESDILGDGKLDYPDEVLAEFDFIVSSVHSILNMDRNKATARLIKAIENPYTTILGHPTGRLLLRREGYPIDHKAVIDACARNNVTIEINANPWRLDLDWRWVHYALSQNVKIAINPDAHDKNDYGHMRYGVLVGRKGGLTKEMTLNAMSLEEITEYFTQRKSAINKQK
jgi:DNA polymerase (family X)